MAQDLNEAHAQWPNALYMIGEWGTISQTTDQARIDKVNETMSAAIRPYIVGFSYWHLGPGGNEGLLNLDFSNRAHFASVSAYFKP